MRAVNNADRNKELDEDYVDFIAENGLPGQVERIKCENKELEKSSLHMC